MLDNYNNNQNGSPFMGRQEENDTIKERIKFCFYKYKCKRRKSSILK